MNGSPVDRVISALERGGFDPRPSGSDQWESRCPSHNGSRHNLSIARGDDGRALLHCHHTDECEGGCSAEEICARLGLKTSDLFATSVNGTSHPTSSPKKGKVHPSAEAAVEAIAWGLRQPKKGMADRTWECSGRWDYCDAGEVVFTVAKFKNAAGDKQYRPFRPEAGGYVVGDPAAPLSLYRKDELPGSSRIYFHEGEACADACAGLGLVSTTTAHGAKSPHKSDLSPLAGRDVTLVLDNDLPGEGYGRSLLALLAKLDPRPRVNIVRFPHLPEGGDVVDWLETLPDGWSPEQCRDELERLAAEAPTEDLEAANDVRIDAVGDGEDWPVPNLGAMPAAPPFPDIVLPGIVSDFVRAQAEAIGCPPDFVALPAIVAAGAAIGRSVSLMLKPQYFVNSSLYGLNVGDPSSGKSPAHDASVRPLWRIDERLHTEYLAEREQYLEDMEKYEAAPKSAKPDRPLKPVITSVVLDDCTQEAVAPHLAINPRGLLISRDEGSAWIASLGQYKKGKGSDRQFFLSALFGKPLRVDRKGNPDLEPIRVPHPFLSVIGNITPEMIGEINEGKGRSDGFVERILFAYPDRVKKPYWSEEGVKEEITQKWAGLLERLRVRPLVTGEDAKPHPFVIGMAPDAKRLWVDWYNSNVDVANSPGFDSREMSVEGKLQDFAARLALILHLMRSADDPTVDFLGALPPVSKWAVVGAIELWSYFREHHRRVRWRLNGGIENSSARSVIDWIKRSERPSFSVKELSDDLRWLKDLPSEPEATLHWMEERHLIRRANEPERPKGMRGRKPHPIYLTNPEINSPRNTRNTRN